jgi:hypothetical protein
MLAYFCPECRLYLRQEELLEEKLGWLVRGLITVRRMMVKRRMAAPVDEPSGWPIMVGVPAGHQDGVD